MRNIKQDINLLERPIWFPTKPELIQEKEVYIYEKNGYKIEFIGLPNHTDVLFLYYLLYLCQENGFKEEIYTTKYEVIESCFGYRGSTQYKQLKEALEKWKKVSVEFKDTFYNGEKYQFMIFGIIDTAEVKENGELYVRFNKEFLEIIKNSQFYKYINFEEFKSLERPTSRRLYELLIKNFYNRTTWKIEIMKLVDKIIPPGLLNYKIYPSHIKKKIEVSLEEINKKTVMTIRFEIKTNKKEQKICIFKREIHKQKPLQQNRISGRGKYSLEDIWSRVIEKERTESVKELIAQNMDRYGKDILVSNIDYSNRNYKKNYLSFLRGALENDWAKPDREKKAKGAQIQEAAREQREEEEKKIAEERQREERLEVEFNRLQQEEKAGIETQARANLVSQGINPEFIISPLLKMERNNILEKQLR
ncbi:MAG: replication initiation protein [Candidatus Omnitrophica bacterium]|nr:replication initiation protein [Candidatus Omnitrophota bacterium]